MKAIKEIFEIFYRGRTPKILLFKEFALFISIYSLNEFAFFNYA